MPKMVKNEINKPSKSTKQLNELLNVSLRWQQKLNFIDVAQMTRVTI